MKLDPRCGLLLLLSYLIVLATIPVGHNRMLGVFCALPLLALLASPLPKVGLLTQACYVLPFSFAIAAVALLRGQTGHAVFFLLRSYASILAALVATRLLTTTELLRAMERLGAPRFLILVCEFLLRYLEVLKAEAESMRLAAICRGAANNRLIAASTIGMLFVRSLERSTAIHNAMLARGFRGVFPRPYPMLWRWPDSLALLGATIVLGSLRVAL
jgi:cobalt/nickel transport system permease protein